MKPLPYLVTLVTLVAAGALSAHSVWIEPDAQGRLVLRFAEPDGRFERSPGHLDQLSPPAAWRAGVSNAPVTLTVEKRPDHFVLGGATDSAQVQAETTFRVISAPGRPGRLPCFYARWHPGGSAQPVPALTLDLVPTDQPGAVRVLFRGRPLPGIRATLRTPDEKEQPLIADAEGMLRFHSVQSGFHMLMVAHHRETLPGFSGGHSYDLTSHNASLSWTQKATDHRK